MKNNLEITKQVIALIESHLLEETLVLNQIAAAIGYSKYHVHRIFSGIVGYPIHQYIRRRRLTEAARALVETAQPIIDIALAAGYQSRQAFYAGFQAAYHCSPQTYRKRQCFLPLQLRYDVVAYQTNTDMKKLSIQVIQADAMHLVGYQVSTNSGFAMIGRSWHRLHKHKARIQQRVNKNYLIGVNDYSNFECTDDHPIFTYMAGAQVSSFTQLPRGMQAKTLPPSTYVVFSYVGKSEDSLQPIVDYVYHDWFPTSTCILNEKNLYDFAAYGEETNEAGYNRIQYWVPILADKKE